MPELLTAAQTAKLLSMRRESLWRAVKAGRLPAPIYLASRMPRWRRSDFPALADAPAGETPTDD